MKAIGLISGVGSLLVGAQRAGFRVVGNVEPRPYYRVGALKDGQKNTFEEYFKAPIRCTWDELTDRTQSEMRYADLAMLHNECGNGSSLSYSGKNWRERLYDKGDFPWVFEHLKLTQPRIFVLDNLAPSLKAVPISEWIEEFPDYHIYPFPVDNARYGNPQRCRTRTFFIGVHKDEFFVPFPGEQDHIPTTRDVIGDLQGKEGTIANHEPHVRNEIATGFRSPYPNQFDRKLTWQEVSDYVLNEMREAQVWPYFDKNGQPKVKIGVYKGKLDGTVNTLNGGVGSFNPWTGLPYSIRERARIQGFPDDFIFYGTKVEEDGSWNAMRNGHMTKQTGKAMPIQWATYIAKRIAEYYTKGVSPNPTKHYYQPPLVTKAKETICGELGGYNGLQERACEVCWHHDNCSVRTRTHSMAQQEFSFVQTSP